MPRSHDWIDAEKEAEKIQERYQRSIEMQNALAGVRRLSEIPDSTVEVHGKGMLQEKSGKGVFR